MSETETKELLGGTTENSVSPNEGFLGVDLPQSLRQFNDFFYIKETEKIELEARPAVLLQTQECPVPIWPRNWILIPEYPIPSALLAEEKKLGLFKIMA